MLGTGCRSGRGVCRLNGHTVRTPGPASPGGAAPCTGPCPELRTHTRSSWDLEPVCWLNEVSLGGNPSSQNSCADDRGDPGQAGPSSVGGDVGASAGSGNPILQHSPSTPSNRLLCRLCLPRACGDLTLTIGGSPRAAVVAGLRHKGEAATGWPAPASSCLNPAVWCGAEPSPEESTCRSGGRGNH